MAMYHVSFRLGKFGFLSSERICEARYTNNPDLTFVWNSQSIRCLRKINLKCQRFKPRVFEGLYLYKYILKFFKKMSFFTE